MHSKTHHRKKQGKQEIFKRYLSDEIQTIEKVLEEEMSKFFPAGTEIDLDELLDAYNGSKERPGPRDIILFGIKLRFDTVKNLFKVLNQVKQGNPHYTLDDRLDLRFHKLANPPKIPIEKKVIYVVYLMYFDRLINERLNTITTDIEKRLLTSPLSKRSLTEKEKQEIDNAKVDLRAAWDKRIVTILDKLLAGDINALLTTDTANAEIIEPLPSKSLPQADSSVKIAAEVVLPTIIATGPVKSKKAPKPQLTKDSPSERPIADLLSTLTPEEKIAKIKFEAALIAIEKKAIKLEKKADKHEKNSPDYLKYAYAALAARALNKRLDVAAKSYFKKELSKKEFEAEAEDALNAARLSALKDHRGHLKEILGYAGLAVLAIASVATLGLAYVVAGSVNYAMNRQFFFSTTINTDSINLVEELSETVQDITRPC